MRPARACTGRTRAGAVTLLQARSGYTLVELLFVLFVAALLAGITVPQVLVGVERARARAAGRYLTAQLGLARTQAVSRAAAVALRFRQDAEGTVLSLVHDGNGDGVREADIGEGIDREISSPVRLEELFPGVAIARPPGAPGAALQLGGTNLLSFTPSGTSSSGSVYLLGRDGSQFAVRVLGVTGRVRLLRFDVPTRRWLDSF